MIAIEKEIENLLLEEMSRVDISPSDEQYYLNFCKRYLNKKKSDLKHLTKTMQPTSPILYLTSSQAAQLEPVTP